MEINLKNIDDLIAYGEKERLIEIFDEMEIAIRRNEPIYLIRVEDDTFKKNPFGYIDNMNDLIKYKTDTLAIIS